MRFKITDNRGRSAYVDNPRSQHDSIERKFPRFKEAPIKEPCECKDEAEKDFSEEEILLLKKLLKNADKLMDLLEKKPEKEEEKEEEDEKLTEKEIDEKEAELDRQELVPDDSKDEEVIETSEEEEEDEIEDSEGNKCAAHDSKKSFGAIETRDSIDDDSIDLDTEIAQAWAKRYGGK